MLTDTDPSLRPYEVDESAEPAGIIRYPQHRKTGYECYLIHGTEAKPYLPIDEALASMLRSVSTKAKFIHCYRFDGKANHEAVPGVDVAEVHIPRGRQNILSYTARRKRDAPGRTFLAIVGTGSSDEPTTQTFGPCRVIAESP